MEQKTHTWTGPTGVTFIDVMEPSGTYYRQGAPREVVSAIEAAMKKPKRVRIFNGDDETGRDWLEENDVSGFVGRSMGVRPCALLVPAGSNGGLPIDGTNIVRLLVDGQEVYRHPKYVTPKIRIENEGAYPECPIAAHVEGVEVHGLVNPFARFKTVKQAERWAAFMRGERMAK